MEFERRSGETTRTFQVSRRFFVADNPTDCESRMTIDYVGYEGIFNRRGRIIASFWRLSDLETILVILNLDPRVVIFQTFIIVINDVVTSVCSW